MKQHYNDETGSLLQSFMPQNHVHKEQPLATDVSPCQLFFQLLFHAHYLHMVSIFVDTNLSGAIHLFHHLQWMKASHLAYLWSHPLASFLRQVRWMKQHSLTFREYNLKSLQTLKHQSIFTSTFFSKSMSKLGRLEGIWTTCLIYFMIRLLSKQEHK